MRSTQFNNAKVDNFFSIHFINTKTGLQTSSKVVEDETTEQIFSRKTDRKAYRAEVLGKRTEAPRRNAKLKKGKVGKKG